MHYSKNVQVLKIFLKSYYEENNNLPLYVPEITEHGNSEIMEISQSPTYKYD